MTKITGFTVERIERMQVMLPPELVGMYTLSPFVWRDKAQYELLLRLVPYSENPAEKISRIHYGRSDDGLTFSLEPMPCIAPGPGMEDQDGCEDPSVSVSEGRYYVYYSGWSETKKQGCLLLADGTDIQNLHKRGIILTPPSDISNPKEATLWPVVNDGWRLFFEYAQGGASKIGLASSPTVDGPWTIQPSPLQARDDSWDNWHLSTGPMLFADPEHPVMFYNGANKDAQWRIGWVGLTPDCTQITARSDEPLITPPKPEGDATDIAFAASAVVNGEEVHLYYSVADKDLCRATLRMF